MLISTQTDAVGKHFGDIEGIKILCEQGFEAIDYSMFAMGGENCILNGPDYREYALKLKAAAAAYGVKFNQAHAPFATMRDGDDAYNERMIPRVKRSIEIAGILGVKAIIVHPVAFKENQFEKNIAMYNDLLPDAKAAGVKIALENMWGRDPETKKIIPNVCSTAEDFPRYVDALPREYFTACLDLGHCGLVGDDAANMIRALGHNRLTCLHIHDNDNIHDSHVMPFTGDMKWKQIAKALREIDYTGDLTLEADGLLNRVPHELVAPMERCLFVSADILRRMTENVSE